MVKTKDNLTGQIFGRLTVLYQVEDHICPNGRHHDQWLCQCSCGSEPIVVIGSSLRYGEHTRSCGCLDSETKASRATKHGDSYTKLYGIYKSMIERCYNVNNKRYDDYGGRGIDVCCEWTDDYEEFKKWAVRTGYKNGLSIDREDNSRGYYPDNCRWVTQKVQANNTRRNRFIEFNGTSKTLAEWSDDVGIEYNTLYGRFRRGWSAADMLTKPVDKNKE